MKKIKNINGYAIYEAGEHDVKEYGFAAGSFYVYFASDIRDFGLPGSTPEFEDCGSIEEAEANCAGNFAIAKEIVEGRTTAASMDEILEVEAQLDAGADPDDIADAEPVIPDTTGSLRAVARESADNLREGIPWVIIYRAGRSWGCLAIWSDVWNNGLETDDLNHALEILRIDPGAVILNGYYCGHLGENMTVDELAAGIRWHYENGYNRLADCEDVQRAQESIETARATAKAAGLPFSERLSAGAEDEPDPYTYDGGMMPEDYDAMQTARDAHEDVEEVPKTSLPSITPVRAVQYPNLVAEIDFHNAGSLDACANYTGVSADLLEGFLAGEKSCELLPKEIFRLVEYVRFSYNGYRRSYDYLFSSKLGYYMPVRPKHWRRLRLVWAEVEAAREINPSIALLGSQFAVHDDLPSFPDLCRMKIVPSALVNHAKEFVGDVYRRQRVVEQLYSPTGKAAARERGITMSRFSSRLKSIDEAAIMKKYGVNALVGKHSKIDSIFAAWELTEEYDRLSVPTRLLEARAIGDNILTQLRGTPSLMLEAEEAFNYREEAALHNGFVLGVQFALVAMKDGGAIWDLIARAGSAGQGGNV